MAQKQSIGTVIGSYLTRRFGLKYSYFAHWKRIGRAVKWGANIKQVEKSPAEVDGVVNSVAPGAEAANVRHALEAAIETGVSSGTKSNVEPI